MFKCINVVLCDVTLRMLMYCLARIHHVNFAIYVLSQHKQLCVVLHITVYALVSEVLIKYLA